MQASKITIHILQIFLLGILSFTACHSSIKKNLETDVIAETPQKVQNLAGEFIEQKLGDIIKNNGLLNDTIQLKQAKLIKALYAKHQQLPLWSNNEKWLPQADSLINFISRCRLYGLFPQDYHDEQITQIKNKFKKDTLAITDRKNATLWGKADLLLTDAFIQSIHDLKLGRIKQDSILLKTDVNFNDTTINDLYNVFVETNSFTKIASLIEPKHTGYQLIKQALKKFLDSTDVNKKFTHIPYLPKDDSLLKVIMQKRLMEENFISPKTKIIDSVIFTDALKKYQKTKGLTVDGKPSETVIKKMNNNGNEKFIRIALTMDKYKLLPEKMPSKYIWVNIPAFTMQLWNADTLKLVSKVVVGKPDTRTPVLNSLISDIVVYPQWSVPNSIIIRDILPAVKRNPAYLARREFTVVNYKGQTINPYSINWDKYTKSIPYRIVQGSGDANALGILKFNFKNKYAVYLHDTNQRHLFSRSNRSLSHGCVRVQEWQKLADYIVYNDADTTDVKMYRIDSLQKKIPLMKDSLDYWLKNKQNEFIPIKNKIPVLIRYFTVEAKNNSIHFIDDIYKEDNFIREKYFSNK